MKKERDAIDRLELDRYILATSRPLTPDNKAALAEIIGLSSLRSIDDIFGCEDLNGLLRKYPNIERSHVQAVALRGRCARPCAQRSIAQLHDDYARGDRGEAQSLCREIPVSNQGETSWKVSACSSFRGHLASARRRSPRCFATPTSRKSGELIAIRNLEEGFARIDDSKRQIFFFDDFLGRIALDERALSTQDTDLARFIGRVRRTAGARFILTTRAYIYEQARLLSEALSDTKLNVSRYVLDVGIYTRRIRARILYNHLVVGRCTRSPHRSANRSESD